MPAMTTQERQEFEARVKEHNFAILNQLSATLYPLRQSLDAVEAFARDLIITEGTEMLRIRDVLTGNISNLKSAMDYHVINTLDGVIAANAPASETPQGA